MCACCSCSCSKWPKDWNDWPDVHNLHEFGQLSGTFSEKIMRLGTECCYHSILCSGWRGKVLSKMQIQSKVQIRSEMRWELWSLWQCLASMSWKEVLDFFLPRMVGYHDTMIGGGLPKPGNSGKNYNHHDFPEGPLWDFIIHSFSDWPHETERKVLGHPNETLCEQSQLSGQLVLVLFRLANASDVCPCSFWLKAGDHKCHRSVPFASWKYMSLYIYILESFNCHDLQNLTSYQFHIKIDSDSHDQNEHPRFPPSVASNSRFFGMIWKCRAIDVLSHVPWTRIDHLTMSYPTRSARTSK